MSITHLTFVDIETVPIDIPELSIERSNLFEKRFKREIEDILGKGTPTYGAHQKFWEDKASLHAEFGKIIAISIGKYVADETGPVSDPKDKAKNAALITPGKFYIRSLTGRDEATLLKQATDSFTRAGGTMVAHNGLEFDFPYLMRRYMVHGLPIPPQLNVAGLKPWEVKLEDTMKMWSGTQWNYKVSLELLCHVLGIPSPKQDISGADVAQIYWDSFKEVEGQLPFDTEERAMRKIGTYCNGDVLACANAYCRMKGLPMIENVEYV
jgi:hypothetical protein